VSPQRLFYAHDIRSLGENISNINRKIEALLDARKESGTTAGNEEQTKCIFVSHHQIAEQN
jgi:hypothetical protein